MSAGVIFIPANGEDVGVRLRRRPAMAYDNLVDPDTGLSIGSIEDGKIIASSGEQVGTVRDGVAYGMAGERWGALSDARAQTSAEPMPDAMRRALKGAP